MSFCTVCTVLLRQNRGILILDFFKWNFPWPSAQWNEIVNYNVVTGNQINTEMNSTIIHDFPPSRYQSFFVLMRVPQSIGMTIMKKFTNKQIVKFEWYEKSLSELLDIIDSIDI